MMGNPIAAASMAAASTATGTPAAISIHSRSTPEFVTSPVGNSAYLIISPSPTLDAQLTDEERIFPSSNDPCKQEPIDEVHEHSIEMVSVEPTEDNPPIGSPSGTADSTASDGSKLKPIARVTSNYRQFEQYDVVNRVAVDSLEVLNPIDARAVGDPGCVSLLDTNATDFWTLIEQSSRVSCSANYGYLPAVTVHVPDCPALDLGVMSIVGPLSKSLARKFNRGKTIHTLLSVDIDQDGDPTTTARHDVKIVEPKDIDAALFGATFTFRNTVTGLVCVGSRSGSYDVLASGSTEKIAQRYYLSCAHRLPVSIRMLFAVFCKFSFLYRIPSNVNGALP